MERSTVDVRESFAFMASLIPVLTLASSAASGSSLAAGVDSVDENRGHAGAFAAVERGERRGQLRVTLERVKSCPTYALKAMLAEW